MKKEKNYKEDTRSSMSEKLLMVALIALAIFVFTKDAI